MRDRGWSFQSGSQARMSRSTAWTERWTPRVRTLTSALSRAASASWCVGSHCSGKERRQLVRHDIVSTALGHQGEHGSHTHPGRSVRVRRASSSGAPRRRARRGRIAAEPPECRKGIHTSQPHAEDSELGAARRGGRGALGETCTSCRGDAIDAARPSEGARRALVPSPGARGAASVCDPPSSAASR